MGNKNSFLNAPDVYMEKLAVGANLPKNFLDLDEPLEILIDKLAEQKKKRIEDVVICVLNRPRHNSIFKIAKKKKCKLFLIPDGDIFGAISTAIDKFDIDIYAGTGGAPEGVLAASVLKCLGGQMQCRLIFNNQIQKKRAKKMGVRNLNKKYLIKDLIKKDAIFVATGVTNGFLLNGIKKNKENFKTHSLIVSTKSKKVKFIKSEFKI